MTPELAICARLLATSAVTAIVSTRVYEIALPQSPRLPAVRVQLVSDPVGYHLRGPDGASRSRVQVDAYVDERATTSVLDPGATLNALGDAIDDCLSGQVFTAGSPISIRVTGVFRQDRTKLREPDELRYLRVMQDYIVWSKAA